MQRGSVVGAAMRIICRAFAALLLVLALLVALLWVRSYWYRGVAWVVVAGSPAGIRHTVTLESGYGGLSIGLGRYSRIRGRFHVGEERIRPAYANSHLPHGFAGIEFGRWPSTGAPGVRLPHWLVMMTLLVPPVLAARRHWWIVRGAGLCPNCGYDLRATPERCPECGTVPEPASAIG